MEESSGSYSPLVIPGDSQSRDRFELWARESLTVGGTVVVRTKAPEGLIYQLAPVESIDLEADSIKVAGFGQFEANGVKAFTTSDRTRLLIPTGDVLKAALEGEVWAFGKLLSEKRTLTDAEKVLAQRQTQ